MFAHPPTLSKLCFPYGYDILEDLPNSPIYPLFSISCSFSFMSGLRLYLFSCIQLDSLVRLASHPLRWPSFQMETFQVEDP